MRIMRILSFFLIGLCLMHCGSQKEPPPKIYFVGLDGADWDTIDPLIKEGKLPFFQRLKSKSAWARLKTFKPTFSPVIWTSIATGKVKEKTGICDWNEGRLSNAVKKAPAIWEINDSFDQKSIVINWFVSFPPDQIQGTVVSDKFKVSLHQILGKRKKNRKHLPESVFPREQYFDLFRYLKKDYEARALNYNQIISMMNIPDYRALFRERYGDKKLNRAILRSWPSFVFYNYITEMVTEKLLQEEEYNLFLTYFRMPDVFMHFGPIFLEKDYFERVNQRIQEFKDDGLQLPDKEKEEFEVRFSEVLYPLLRHKEKILEKIYNKARRENAYMIVASDHGFKLWDNNYNHTGLPEGISPPDGILMVLGPGVNQTRIEANVYDIVPTMLYMMNKPVGKEMDGKPLVDAFHFRNPIRYRVYKKRKTVSEKSTPELDEKTREELKSLGYID